MDNLNFMQVIGIIFSLSKKCVDKVRRLIVYVSIQLPQVVKQKVKTGQPD